MGGDLAVTDPRTPCFGTELGGRAYLDFVDEAVATPRCPSKTIMSMVMGLARGGGAENLDTGGTVPSR